jgi:hypothetical protein
MIEFHIDCSTTFKRRCAAEIIMLQFVQFCPSLTFVSVLWEEFLCNREQLEYQDSQNVIVQLYV